MLGHGPIQVLFMKVKVSLTHVNVFPSEQHVWNGSVRLKVISPMVCFCCSVPVEPLRYHYHVCILMVTPGWRLE